MTDEEKPDNVEDFAPKDEQPQRPNVPIGSVELRTFMHRPMCGVCASKGVHRFLIESEGKVAQSPHGDAMAVWVCDHCEHSVSLPPGLFPQYEHREVHLESTKPQPRPKDAN